MEKEISLSGAFSRAESSTALTPKLCTKFGTVTRKEFLNLHISSVLTNGYTDKRSLGSAGVLTLRAAAAAAVCAAPHCGFPEAGAIGPR